MALPDFFIVGAPKAGTSALHAALASHPSLFLPAVKEPKFFLCDGRPPVPGRGPGDAHSTREWIWDRARYEALYAEAPAGVLRGEATPLYLSDPAALDRMASAVPRAKLIAVLRDPVDRAYSNWAHLWADGLEPRGDFLAACDAESDRAAAGWAPFWRYLGLGRYGEQLAHVYDRFGRDQVHLVRYRELVDEPARTLDGLCRFLGVRPGLAAHPPGENVGTYVPDTATNRVLRAAVRTGARLGSRFPPGVWRRASVPLLRALQRSPQHRPDLDPEVRAELRSRLAEDIARLEALTGTSYQDWLTGAAAADGTYSVRRSWAPLRRVVS